LPLPFFQENPELPPLRSVSVRGKPKAYRSMTAKLPTVSGVRAKTDDMHECDN
jgi:hypothetical protein